MTRMGQWGSTKYLLVFLAFAIILGSYSAGNQSFASAPSDPVDFFPKDTIQITYLGCDTTVTPTECTWNVNNISNKQNISHFVVGLDTCTEYVEGTIPDNLEVAQMDPTTGVFGLKWNESISKGEQFDVTIQIQVPADITLVDHAEDNLFGVKAGNKVSIQPVDGPLCTPDVFPPVLSIDSVTAETASIAFDTNDPPNAIVTPGTDFTTTGTTDVNDNRLFTVDATSSSGAPVSWQVVADDGPITSGMASLSCTNDSGAANPTDATISGVQQIATVTATDIQYGIPSEISDKTSITCTGTDNVGNSAQLTVILTVADQQPPIIIAPPDTAVVDPTGVHTALDIDTDVVHVADLVSSPSVTDDRNIVAPNVEGCEEKDNDGNTVENSDTDPCFFAGTTTINYTATDAASLSTSDTQSVVINQPVSTIAWDEIEYQIESSGRLTYNGYLENNDNGVRDIISGVIVTSTSDDNNGGSGINVQLTETENASNEFTLTLAQPRTTFSVVGTDDATDTILASVCDTVTASHEATAPAAPSGSDTQTAITTASITYPGTACSANLPTSNNPVKWDTPGTNDESAAPGEGLLVYIEDITGKLNSSPNTVQKTNKVLRITSESDSTGFAILIKEQGVDTDLFKTTVYITPIEASTDKRKKYIEVDLSTEISELVTATFKDPDTGAVVATAQVTVTAENLNDLLVFDPTAPDITLRVACDIDDDIDGDFICDSYEDNTLGLRIPVTDDQGTEDTADDVTTTYILECNPGGNAGARDPICPGSDRKDFYQEGDWYTGHEPDPDAIQIVVDVFDAMSTPNSHIPAEVVAGNEGVRYHFLRGEDIGIHRNLLLINAPNNPSVGFYQIKLDNFGTPDERAGINGDGTSGHDPDQLLTAKRLVFHYAFFAHQLNWAPTSPGYGELLANDIIIAPGALPVPSATNDQLAAIIIHENGHNLGLHHGGSITDPFNCKVQYLSVMNYAYEFADLVPDRPLAFSHENLGQINPLQLIEKDGIQQYTVDGTVSSFVYGEAGANPTTTTSLSGIPVDWNLDDFIDMSSNPPSVSASIYNLGIPGCTFEGFATTEGHDDEANFNFNMQAGGGFASSAMLTPESLDEIFTEAIAALQAEALSVIGVLIATTDPADVTGGQTEIDFLLGLVSPGLDACDLLVLNSEFIDMVDPVSEGAISCLVNLKARVDVNISGDTEQPILAAIQDTIVLYTDISTPDSSTASTSLAITPIAEAAGPYFANEGDTLILDGSLSGDPDDTTCNPGSACDRLTYDWDFTGISVTVDTSAGGNAAEISTEWGDNGSFSVDLTVTDDGNDENGDPYRALTGALLGTQTSEISSAIVSISNVAPSIDSIGVEVVLGDGSTISSMAAIDGQEMIVEVGFSDPGADDTHITIIDWGDETDTTSSDVSPVIASHTYSGAGSFTITVTVEDDDGGSSSDTVNVAIISGCDPLLTSPIDGSQYKVKRTIPAKFSVCAGNNTPVDDSIAATLEAKLIIVHGTEGELTAICKGHIDNTADYNADADTFQCNLLTKGFPTGAVTLFVEINGITLPDAVGITLK